MVNLAHSFVDRIVNVAVTGPMVRIELGVLNRPESKDQLFLVEPNQVLVMPLEGFVNSFGILEALMKKLVEDGVLKPTPPIGPDALSTNDPLSPMRGE